MTMPTAVLRRTSSTTPDGVLTRPLRLERSAIFQCRIVAVETCSHILCILHFSVVVVVVFTILCIQTRAPVMPVRKSEAELQEERDRKEARRFEKDRRMAQNAEVCEEKHVCIWATQCGLNS